MSFALEPDECTTMSEVRTGVDSVDRSIGTLLARRFGYMRAAARIKPARDAVRDEVRKSEVIANAVAHAGTLGYPGTAAAALWELLVELSIAQELEWFDGARGRAGTVAKP